MTIPNGYRKQYFEPKLPLNRSGGLYERCTFRWENIPAIQMMTDPAWWGNAVSSEQIGHEYAVTEGEIKSDGVLLKRMAALAEDSLSYLKRKKIADSVTAVTRNPAGNRLETSVTIVESKTAPGIILNREYVSPGVAQFWLSTLGGTPMIESTLSGTPQIQSTFGGV